MKKICFVTTVPMTIRTFVIPLVCYLSENTTWDITVVCDDDPFLQEELPVGVRYFPISMKRGISFSGVFSTKKLYNLFQRESFDLVQYSTPNAAFYASIAACLAGVKHRKYHLMGFRYLGFTGFKKSAFKMIERICCLLSTSVECVSNSNMNFGINEKLFPANKAKVIFHGSSAGVDLSRFDIKKKADWRTEVRRTLGYTEQHCVFGFVGRITGDKGINELLQAFVSLSSGENKLLLVGEIEKDGLNTDLLSKAETNPDIAIHSFVNDIERYFAGMDVLVLPSYREGFGNVIIEAQAMGVPVIVTDIIGPVDAMIQEETGIVVHCGDIRQLSNAMQRLSIHPELRARFGEQGVRLVKECFDTKELMEHFLQDLKKLLND